MVRAQDKNHLISTLTPPHRHSILCTSKFLRAKILVIFVKGSHNFCHDLDAIQFQKEYHEMKKQGLSMKPLTLKTLEQ